LYIIDIKNGKAKVPTGYSCVFYGAAGDARNYFELSGCGIEDKRETRI
jgi:hypothetical protein